MEKAKLKGDFIDFSSTEITTASAATSALSNKRVLEKINNFQNVFVPSPQQRPINGAFPCIIEYQESPTLTSTSGQSDVSHDIRLERDETTSTTPQGPLDLTFTSPVLSSAEFHQHNSAMSLSDVFAARTSPESSIRSQETPGKLNSANIDQVQFNHQTDQLNRNRQMSAMNGCRSSFESHDTLRFQYDNGHHDTSNLNALNAVNNLHTGRIQSAIYDNVDSLEDLIKDPFENGYTINEYSCNNALAPYNRASTRSPVRHHFSNLIAASPAYTSSSDSHDEDYTNSVPPSLAPLPDILLEVPVYRELFHHFVNVTADVLVPLPKLYTSNPFKVVLPRMAMNVPHLLSLIIAYGATHHARIINQPEPIGMITKLLDRTFDGLSQCLEDPVESKSNATLATAMMLCSYEIITATANDRWKTHLQGAREIVVARGMASSLSGGVITSEALNVSNDNMLSIDNSINKFFGPQPIRTFSENMLGNDTLYFLIRLFAYLDIIGSLSSPTASSVLTTDESVSQLWSLPNGILGKKGMGRGMLNQLETGTKIDLFLGLDLDILPVFAKASALCRKRLRLDDLENAARREDIELEKHQLLSDALELSNILLTCCSSDELVKQEELKEFPNFSDEKSQYNQLKTMNQCFGYAVLIHLYRRVLRFASDSPTVQEIVGIVTMLLDNTIPCGSSTEACMIFPIFTAAAEVHDPIVRNRYRQRLNGMKRFGAPHIEKAMEILEECWTTNHEWVDIMAENGWSIVLA